MGNSKVDEMINEDQIDMDQKELFEKVISYEQLYQAYRLVRSNRGAPGVDGITVEKFGENFEEELSLLSKELGEWKYRPLPVKRVEIPKPDSTEKRLLGIPSVRDRVLAQSLKLSLEKLFEPEFSPNSFGFRPERGQQQAISQARDIVNRGKNWVVDIDLEKFFDRINHDKVIYLLKRKVNDKRVLRLVGLCLRSGVLTADGQYLPSREGSVQGSPLSPLLSNIVLDELDKELERRGLEFCRYADDCNIFVGSEKAGIRVMASIGKFIEHRLKLKINRNKSKVALARAVKFLGFTIVAGMILISPASMKRAMSKVRELIPRGDHLPLEIRFKKVNQWYVGWSAYYRLTETPSQLKAVEAHIRRRFRSQFIGQQKRKRHLYRKLLKLGVKSKAAANIFKPFGRWRLSHTFAVEKGWDLTWFSRFGLKIISNKQLSHWKPLNVWIKLT